MFVVAGAVIEKVSGLSWEDFVQTRIFDKVGMSESVPLARLADPKKSALLHGRVGPPLRYQGAMTQIAESIVEVWNWNSAAAAGGICASAHDWAKWIAVRLNDGKLADGSRLFWKPLRARSTSPTSSSPGRETDRRRSCPTGRWPRPTPWACRCRTIAASVWPPTAAAVARPHLGHGADPGPQDRLLGLHQRRGELPAARPALGPVGHRHEPGRRGGLDRRTRKSARPRGPRSR